MLGGDTFMRLSRLTKASLVAAASLFLSMSLQAQRQTSPLKWSANLLSFRNTLRVSHPVSPFNTVALRPAESTFSTTYSNSYNWSSPIGKITAKLVFSDVSDTGFIHSYDLSEITQPSSNVVHCSPVSILPDDSAFKNSTGSTTVFTYSGITQEEIVSDFYIADRSDIYASRYSVIGETFEALGGRFTYHYLHEFAQPRSYVVFSSASLLPDESAFKNMVANTTLFIQSGMTQGEIVSDFSIADRSHNQLALYSFPSTELSKITNLKTLASSSDFRFVDTTVGPTLKTSIFGSGERDVFARNQCNCFSATRTSGKHPEIELDIDGPTVSIGISQIGSFN